MTTRPDLADFEGLPVRQVGLELPGAAGGLREALKVDPVEFRQGDQFVVVLDCVTAKIRHEPITKDEPDGDQRRVHIAVVEGATIVDRSIVAEHLAQQALRIERAREAEKGIGRLSDENADGWDDVPGPLDAGTADGGDKADPATSSDAEWEDSAHQPGTNPTAQPDGEGDASVSSIEDGKAAKAARGSSGG